MALKEYFIFLLIALIVYCWWPTKCTSIKEVYICKGSVDKSVVTFSPNSKVSKDTCGFVKAKVISYKWGMTEVYIF